MIISCLQPKIYSEKQKCYNEVENLTKTIFKQTESCDLIILPERWVPLSKDIKSSVQQERGENYTFIKDLAKRYSVKFLTGAIWEHRKNQKMPSITCYFIDEKGKEVGRQDKIHLYSYEQKFFNPGKTLNIFKLSEKYRFAVLICFDMAFFETPRFATENGADILFSPTQIREDGMENWKIYLQARALENRIPVAACNSLGTVMERKFLGNSKIISFSNGFISPSKLRVLEAPIGSKGVIYDDLDLDFPRKLRKIRLKEKVDVSSLNL
ncbi:MAG: carbon-nitrogen hydrolase family protein, partial [Promethearchaeota archaeon]